MKFADERMKVGKIILSEVTQSEKEKHRTFSFTCASGFDSPIMFYQPGVSV